MTAGGLASEITALIRRFKSDNNKPLNAPILIRVACSDETKSQIELVADDIKGTSKLKLGFRRQSKY